jgi:hypothetical protein
MSTFAKLFAAPVLIIACLFPAAAAPAGHLTAHESLSSYGFDISIDELFELLSFQRSARLDSKAKVEADWSGRFDKLALRELDKSENRYVYAVDPLRKRQIIAIRGTANLVNALLDLESWKDLSPELGIRLHHGFEKAATLVFEDVRAYLDPNLPIVICGHSLGAAESIIVGMLLAKAGYRVEKIVASGPPKVTDAAGIAAWASLPVVLVTAAFDPVPFLPPASLYPKAPFVQGGPLLMLLDGPYVSIAPPEYYEAMGPAFKEVKQLSERFDVVDHRVWTYGDRAGEKLQGIVFVPFSEWQAHAVPRK